MTHTPTDAQRAEAVRRAMPLASTARWTSAAPDAYVDDALDALLCAEGWTDEHSNTHDAALVKDALDRLGAYGYKISDGPTSSLVQGWILPSVEKVATDARSVRVRREGATALKALIRAERTAVLGPKETA